MDQVDRSELKCDTDVAQQKWSNNKYYASPFRYNIDISIDWKINY